MSPKDALRAVRLERGSVEIAKEVVRCGGWESVLEACWRDWCYWLRVLRKSPGFTLIALLTLTLGLGINCAIFTVVNAVLLRPLPYPDSERLVLVERHFPEITFPGTSVTKFIFWREHSRDFESMTAYGFAFSGVNLTGAGAPEHLSSLRISVDFFRTLGTARARPRLHGGRRWSWRSERGCAQLRALARRFGRDTGILGRAIRLGGELWTIMGVASANFTFAPTADVWIPLRAQPNPNDQTNVCNVLGRLHQGASYSQVNQDLRAVGEELRREYPGLMPPHETLAIRSYQDAIVGDVRRALLLVLGAVGFVLLIACANLANLLLSRSSARRKEMVVRLALGADRLRLTRQLLIESSLLAFTGGGLGLAATSGLLPLLLMLSPPDLPRLGEVHIDWRVWIFAFAVAFATGVVFGLVPALQGPKAELRHALHESVGRASSGRATARLQRLLGIAEVALSGVLLVGAGLLIQTFYSSAPCDACRSPRRPAL